MWYIKTKSMGFYYKVPTTPPTFPKTMFKNSSYSPDFPSLGSPKSHHHDSKPTRIQNSKL
jgi:hypothetical protein